MEISRVIPYIFDRKVVCFCGAGLSRESGVPTFRGEEGLWARYSPEIYATREGLEYLAEKQPLKLRDFVVEFYRTLLESEPNYAHYALARMEKEGVLVGTITQNIDDFSYQAGARKVAELHGNAFLFVCPVCSGRIRKSREEMREFLEEIRRIKSGTEVTAAIGSFAGMCRACRVFLRPSVVLFGEALPAEEVKKAEEYLDDADTLICVGTSAQVYPAAYFPYRAYNRGITLINVNPEPTVLDEVATFSFRMKAVSFFKEIEAVKGK